jgi:hypothetical protein
MGASGWGAPGPPGRCPETSDGHVHPRRRNVQLARERVSALALMRQWWVHQWVAKDDPNSVVRG